MKDDAASACACSTQAEQTGVGLRQLFCVTVLSPSLVKSKHTRNVYVTPNDHGDAGQLLAHLLLLLRESLLYTFLGDSQRLF